MRAYVYCFHMAAKHKAAKLLILVKHVNELEREVKQNMSLAI